MSDQQWPPLDRAVGKIAFVAILLTIGMLIMQRQISGESILQAIASLAGTAGAWRGSVPVTRRPSGPDRDYDDDAGSDGTSGGSPA